MKLKRLVATLLTVVVLMGLLPMTVTTAAASTQYTELSWQSPPDGLVEDANASEIIGTKYTGSLWSHHDDYQWFIIGMFNGGGFKPFLVKDGYEASVYVTLTGGPHAMTFAQDYEDASLKINPDEPKSAAYVALDVDGKGIDDTNNTVLTEMTPQVKQYICTSLAGWYTLWLKTAPNASGDLRSYVPDSASEVQTLRFATFESVIDNNHENGKANLAYYPLSKIQEVCPNPDQITVKELIKTTFGDDVADMWYRGSVAGVDKVTTENVRQLLFCLQYLGLPDSTDYSKAKSFYYMLLVDEATRQQIANSAASKQLSSLSSNPSSADLFDTITVLQYKASSIGQEADDAILEGAAGEWVSKYRTFMPGEPFIGFESRVNARDLTVYAYSTFWKDANRDKCPIDYQVSPVYTEVNLNRGHRLRAQVDSAVAQIQQRNSKAQSTDWQKSTDVNDSIESFVLRMYASYGVMEGIVDISVLNELQYNQYGQTFFYGKPPAFMNDTNAQVEQKGAYYFLVVYNEFGSCISNLVNSLGGSIDSTGLQNNVDVILNSSDTVLMLYQMLEAFNDNTMWALWNDRGMSENGEVSMSDVYDFLVARHAFDAKLNLGEDGKEGGNWDYFFKTPKGEESQLSQSMLEGIKQSATFLPMNTNVYDPATWRDSVDKAWLLNYYAKFGYFRKALYIDTAADAAVTYGNTGGRGQLEVATLSDLLEDKDIVLYIDDNLYNVNTLSELIGKSWDRLGQDASTDSQDSVAKLGGYITQLWEISMPELAKTGERTTYSSRLNQDDANSDKTMWGGLFFKDVTDGDDTLIESAQSTAATTTTTTTTTVDPNATPPANSNQSATASPGTPGDAGTQPGDQGTTTGTPTAAPAAGTQTVTTTVSTADATSNSGYKASARTDNISYYLYPDLVWDEATGEAVSESGEKPHTTEYTPLFGFAVLSAIYKSDSLKSTLNNQLTMNQPVFVSSGSAPYVCESLQTSIYNYMLLRNIEAQMPVDYTVSLDMTSPLYMDVFGNILTESGYVVVPAAANATLWSSDYVPRNAAFFACYGDAWHLPVYDTDSSDAIDKMLTEGSQPLCTHSEGAGKGGVYLLNALRTTDGTVNAAMLSTANKDALADLADTWATQIKSPASYNLSKWKMIITEVLRGAPIENIDKQFEGIQTDVNYTRNGLIIADKLETLCNAIAPAGQNASLAIPNPAFIDGIEIIVFFVYKLLILAVLIIWMVNVYLDATGGTIGWRTGAKCIGVVVLVLALIVGVPKIFEISYYESNKLLLQDETEYLLMLNTEKKANGQEIGVTKVRVPETNTKLYLHLADINMPWWDLLPKIGLSAGYKSLDEMYKDYTDRHPLAYSEYATTMNDGIYISTDQLFESTKVQFSPLTQRMFVAGSDNTPASYYTPYYFFLYSIVDEVTNWSKSDNGAVAYTTKVQKGGELKTLGYSKLYFESEEFEEGGEDYFHLYQIYDVPSEKVQDPVAEDVLVQLRESQWCSYGVGGVSQKAYLDRISKLYDYAKEWIANNHDMIGRVSDETFLKCFALSCAMEHNRLFNTQRADYLEIQELSNEDLLRLSIADHNKVMSNSSMSYARFVYTTGGTMACYTAAILELVNLVSSWVKPACTLLVFCIACISIFVLKLILRRGNNSIMGYVLTIALMCSVNVLGAAVNKLSMYLPTTGLTPTLCILVQILVQVAYIFVQIKIVGLALRDWRNVGYQQYEHQFNKIHFGRTRPMLSSNVNTPRGTTGYKQLDNMRGIRIGRKIRK